MNERIITPRRITEGQRSAGERGSGEWEGTEGDDGILLQEAGGDEGGRWGLRNCPYKG